MQFKRATKEQSYGRIALFGPSGSGKTYTALRIASGMGRKIAVIDTERGSASKYADKFSFDVLNLDKHSPLDYVEAIQCAEEAGYDVVIIDSLSHAWMGTGGVMEQVDNASDKNKFTAWKDPSSQHKKLINAMVGCAMHVIATMRSKTKYEVVTVEKNGRNVTKPEKIGLAPEQREGMDYEFDLLALLNQKHVMTVDKTRCDEFDGFEAEKVGEEFGKKFLAWVRGGVRTEFIELSDAFRNSITIKEVMDIRARIKPAFDAGKLTKSQVEQLAGIRETVTNALRKSVGEIINDYHEAKSLEEIRNLDAWLTEHKDDYTADERQKCHIAASTRTKILNTSSEPSLPFPKATEQPTVFDNGFDPASEEPDHTANLAMTEPKIPSDAEFKEMTKGESNVPL